MIERHLKAKIVELFQKFPAVAILGPRQSGKTTIAKEAFPHLSYVNLEDLSKRSHAQEDSKDFLDSYGDGVIIDEIQNVPELFSYLQLYIDKKDRPGLYILTGSHQILLNERISQSLAGRIAITNLLPLSLDECYHRFLPKSYDDVIPTPAGIHDIQLDSRLRGNDIVSRNGIVGINDIIFRGFYPRLHRYEINPTDFYPNYIQTYIKKDIRQIKNISNLSLFQKFIKLCAGRIGQILNLSSLANDCGISHVTAKEWISLLEMSYIIYQLKPHHQNFKKRLIKSPKLYFCDTGLACSLLDLNSAEQLESHYLKGALFENLIVAEYLKSSYNKGKKPACYFWRDQVGNEIDMIVEHENKLIPIEIKSGKTVSQDYFKNLSYWRNLSGEEVAYVIYNGDENVQRSGCEILRWQDAANIWRNH
jgi:predicted AAA+ superfamily ATPase